MKISSIVYGGMSEFPYTGFDLGGHAHLTLTLRFQENDHALFLLEFDLGTQKSLKRWLLI